MKYAIAAGHEITKDVAEQILKSGGNAFDATVAAYLAMFVSEPAMASAGSGGFANIVTENDENFIIDFFCQTPISKSINSPHLDEIEVDFGPTTEIFYAGPASMAVPGAIAIIMYLVKHYCSIPLKELIQPAQKLATEGVALSPFQTYDIELLHKICGLTEKGRDLYYQDGRIKVLGEVIRLKDYSLFLDSLANEKEDWFYRGEPAASIVDINQSLGGFLTMDDFKNYKLLISEPYRFQFAGSTITCPNLPSLGGWLMNIFFQNLSPTPVQPGSKDHLQSLLKSFESCRPYKEDIQLLIKYAMDQEDRSSTQGDSDYLKTGGTSHFNIVDGKGNAVSLSTSLGEGSGYFIPGTDMQMNNMLGETALLPGGLNSWHLDRRLNSMMTPTMAFNDKAQLRLVTGTGGATRIPFSLAQLFYNHLVLGLGIDRAIHFPRAYLSHTELYLEKGLDYNGIDIPYDLRIWDEPHLLFGGTHSIDMLNEAAVGDSRREGSAVMYSKTI